MRESLITYPRWRFQFQVDQSSCGWIPAYGYRLLIKEDTLIFVLETAQRG